ncbi:hypothetical protein [Sinomicrobium sp.]
MSDADIKDSATADLYVAMLKACAKIESNGELELSDVDRLDLACWVWLSEREMEKEMMNEK